MKIQPQSGLGDLLFTLPLIEYCLHIGEPVTVATNHSFLLDMYGGQVQSEPVEINYGNPVIKKDFIHLKYTRYKCHYFDNYFFRGNDSIDKSLVEMATLAKTHLINYAQKNTKIEFGGLGEMCLFAPPRATARDKAKKIFPRAPDPKYAESRAKAAGRVVVIGQNELFAPGVDISHHESLLDKLTFWDLVLVMWQAKCVVSQISMITALAGVLGKPTDFLPARNETIMHHEKHVSGVLWPFQEMI